MDFHYWVLHHDADVWKVFGFLYSHKRTFKMIPGNIKILIGILIVGSFGLCMWNICLRGTISIDQQTIDQERSNTAFYINLQAQIEKNEDQMREQRDEAWKQTAQLENKLRQSITLFDQLAITDNDCMTAIIDHRHDESIRLYNEHCAITKKFCLQILK